MRSSKPPKGKKASRRASLKKASLRRSAKGGKGVKGVNQLAGVSIGGPTGFIDKSKPGVFGVSISESMDTMKRISGIWGRFSVPPFVEKLCLYIETFIYEEEGIFRKAGKEADIERYRNEINRLDDAGISFDFAKTSPHVACDLLKRFLKEMPDPLLTFELYDCFFAKAKASMHAGEPVQLHGLIEMLPPENQATLKRIVACLRKVVTAKDLNRMDAANLGTVFGPNLLRPADEITDAASMMEGFEITNAITLALINDYEDLFRNTSYTPLYQAYIKVSHDFEPTMGGQLSLKRGQLLLLLEEDPSGWWLAHIEGNADFGYMPAAYCTWLDGRPCA